MRRRSFAQLLAGAGYLIAFLLWMMLQHPKRAFAVSMIISLLLFMLLLLVL